MSEMKWYGAAAKQAAQAELDRRVAAAALLVEAHAKELVSTSGTTGPGEGYADRKYGSNPSAPGEPPHKQTGHLRRSITWERSPSGARVGTNLDYGRWLELGTRMMAARPWLRRALAERKAAIAALFAKKFF